MANDCAAGGLFGDTMSGNGSVSHQMAISAKKPLPLKTWLFRTVVQQDEIGRVSVFVLMGTALGASPSRTIRTVE